MLDVSPTPKLYRCEFEPLVKILASRKIRMVTAGNVKAKVHVPHLVVDYRHGIQQALEHLAALGHTDIAFITGPKSNTSSQKRLMAFKAAMHALHLPVEAKRIVTGDYKLEAGQRALEVLMQQKTLPTAIVCANDMMAIGAQNAASMHGLRIPEDISIVGFDDIHIAEFMSPPLTTVRMSCTDLGQAAVNVLICPKAGKRREMTTITTSLIVRNSTGPVCKRA